ncbi:MAG: ABC transporter substrate-binding protein [Deferrisomatales bacterium]
MGLPAPEVEPPPLPVLAPRPDPGEVGALLDEGRFREALEALAAPEEGWPGTLWAMRAGALAGLGRRAEAARALGAALAAGGEGTHLHRVALRSLLELLEEEELEEVVWACPLCPEAGYALLRWAQVRDAAGDRESAESLLREVARGFGGTPPADEAEALLARWSADRAGTPGLYGLLLPLSGPIHLIGERALRGALVASGLLDGEEDPGIRLVVVDSRGEAEAAAQGVRDLAAQGVMGILGPLRAAAAGEAARVAREVGVPLLAPSPSPAASGGGAFRLYLREEDEIARLVEHAVLQRGLSRFAILYPETPLGRRYRDLFWDEAVARGAEITGVEAFPAGSRDLGDEIRRLTGVFALTEAEVRRRFLEEERLRSGREQALLSALGLSEEAGGGSGEHIDPERLTRYKPPPIVDFDAVFLPASGLDAAQIAPQLPFHDVEGVLLLGIRTWNHPSLVQVGQEYVAQALFPAEFHPGLAGAVDFSVRYQREYGEVPGVIEAYAYDGMKLLRELASPSGPGGRAELRRRLEALWAAPGVTGPLTAHPSGDISAEPKILTVRRGRIVPAE